MRFSFYTLIIIITKEKVFSFSFYKLCLIKLLFIKPLNCHHYNIFLYTTINTSITIIINLAQILHISIVVAISQTLNKITKIIIRGNSFTYTALDNIFII